MKYYLMSLLFVLPCAIAQDHSQFAHTREFYVTCDHSDVIFKMLEKKYKEVPIAIGITNDPVGSQTTIWYNEERKTFTVLQSHEGITCVIATGQQLEVRTDDIKSGTSI
jgi:hypothetical protein